MNKNVFDPGKIDIAWCPGCGNFGILKLFPKVFAELGITPSNLVLVSGIGQAAKTPQYLRCNYFNGLHGRALPAATAIKMANPELTVVAVSGDGCMYGEGGNHFIHAVRRNPDIACLVHDNMIYGLTKGQASPTSLHGMKTPVQTHGVFSEPFNPLATAIGLGASFVARAYIGDPEGTAEIIKKAVGHRGFALVDIFQPCVSYNKLNTYRWFKEKTYYLEDEHDVSDRAGALRRALETDRLPLGVFFVNPDRKPFDEEVRGHLPDTKQPLFRRRVDLERLEKLIKGMN